MATRRSEDLGLARTAYVLRQFVRLPGSYAAQQLGVELDRLYALEAEYIVAARSSRIRVREAQDQFLDDFHARLPLRTIAERLGISAAEVRARLDELGLETIRVPVWSSARIRQGIARRMTVGANMLEALVWFEEPALVEAARSRYGSWLEALRRASSIVDGRSRKRLRGSRDRGIEEQVRRAWILRNPVGLTQNEVARVLGVESEAVHEFESEFAWLMTVSTEALEAAREEFLRQFCVHLRPQTLAERLGVAPAWILERLAELGLAPANATKWPANRVIDSIHHRFREGRRLAEGTVLWEEPELFEAAHRAFGSWAAAREAASQVVREGQRPPARDPGRPRAAGRRGRPSQSSPRRSNAEPRELRSLIAAIKRRAANGASLDAPEVLRESPELLRAANALCGSWTEALALARRGPER